MLQRKGLKPLFTLLAVLILLMSNLKCNSNSQDTVPLLASSDHGLLKAPRFVLRDLEGNLVSSQRFAGKVTILNFWATWCKFCRIEFPHLNELYKAYKDQGVEIIGISLDYGGAADVIPFTKKVSIDYPILIGTQDTASAFGGIIGLPTTIVIDREWQVYQRYPGVIDKTTMEQDINLLLARD